mmetsp:Transcript_97260/g.280656  ORF Transcript_97260/g.280656 Transcript_97260/m.280656 type:complete len:224 (+) Transcript_97260:240-911(+)
MAPLRVQGFVRISPHELPGPGRIRCGLGGAGNPGLPSLAKPLLERDVDRLADRCRVRIVQHILPLGRGDIGALLGTHEVQLSLGPLVQPRYHPPLACHVQGMACTRPLSAGATSEAAPALAEERAAEDEEVVKQPMGGRHGPALLLGVLQHEDPEAQGLEARHGAALGNCGESLKRVDVCVEGEGPQRLVGCLHALPCVPERISESRLPVTEAAELHLVGETS